MAATASIAPVASGVDFLHADIGHTTSNTFVSPFLRLPRELRDQVCFLGYNHCLPQNV